MRNIVAVLFFVAFIFGCSKEPVIDIREGMTFDPDSLIIESSALGWELYSWQSGDIWKYSLVVGTETSKSVNEILASPYVVAGREQLKLLIRQLPSGEEITWYGEEWIGDNLSGVTEIFVDPPILTQYDIHIFCRNNYCDLIIVP
jgi:hypothetical protein